MKARLIDYFDVWGNEEDGWEVNNLCVLEDDIYISENTTNEDILDFLFAIGYLNTTENICIREYGMDMLEIETKKEWYPIGRLEIYEH